MTTVPRYAIILAVLAAALASTNVSVGFAAVPSTYPRLLSQWPDPVTQDLPSIARYDVVLLQPRFASSIEAIRGLRPGSVLLTSTNACELPINSADNAPGWSNEQISRVPNSWILTQLGGKLTKPVTATSRLIYVSYASRFRVGDICVLENELVRVERVYATSIYVTRGIIPARSPATAHAAAKRIAPVVVFWPGTVVMDLSTYCPKATVEASIGPETWAQYNARVGVRLLDDGVWDGIFSDRTDAYPKMMVGKGTTRNIDPARSNIAVTDGYAALNSKWRDGLLGYEARIRAAAGTRIFLSNNAYTNFAALNGTILEGVPRPSWTAFDWENRLLGIQQFQGRSYLDWCNRSKSPNISTLQTYESDVTPITGAVFVNPAEAAGWKPNFKKMRFGLASALMGNGFFSYEMGTAGHARLGLLWFDEYDNAGTGRGYLGASAAAARLALPPLTSRDRLNGDGSFSTRRRFSRWETYARSGYSVTSSLSQQTARLAITRSKGSLNSASFSHGRLPVSSKGAYTLTFRARASVALSIAPRIARVESPFTSLIYYGPVNLTTSWKRFELSGVSAGTDPAAALSFGVGAKKATIWIDDVKIKSGSRLGVYRRDFRRGTVLVNATTTSRTVGLGALYRRIRGIQATTVNSGAYVRSVVLPSKDGLILLKTPTLSLSGAGTIGFGASRSLAGVGVAPGGGSLSQRQIILQQSVDGNTWADSQVTTSTVTGSYCFTVKPQRITKYRVRCIGTVAEPGATSAVVTVAVRPYVGTPYAAAVASVNRSFIVTGTLNPRHPEGTTPVRIYAWRLTSAGWKSSGSYPASVDSVGDSLSLYRRSLTLSRAGKWRIRARHIGDALHTAAWSPAYRYLTIR